MSTKTKEHKELHKLLGKFYSSISTSKRNDISQHLLELIKYLFKW